MEDVLFQNGSMQVVSPITQGNLSELKTHAHPIGSYVVEIIEVNTADSDGPQPVEPRRRVLDRDLVVFGMIWQRNKSNKTTRLILQRAQLAQMIHAILKRLHMTVEHRAGAAASQLVPLAVHIQVF